MPKRILIPLLLSGVALLCVWPTARAGPPEERAAALQDYVGSETCAECHEDQMADYRKSVHYQTETGDWDVTGCESCHGPGAQHTEEGDIQYIFSFASADHTVGEKVDKCLSCHGEREKQYNFPVGNHMKGTIDCATCHKPHAGAGQENLLPEGGYKLCLDCHQEVAAGFNLNERHRVLEGIVQCTDCHNQHAQSTRERLGGFKHENCYKCHTDKQGPWVFEHLSVRVEGCTACHTSPHGSVNRHLLAYQNMAQLCYSCHTVVPGFHAPPRFITESNCVNCHSMIHGSNLHHAFLK